MAGVDDPGRDEKSRSQIKREFRELKELGKRLAALSDGQLAAVPLAARTRDAVRAAKTMQRGALQRQYRHLSSLLAEEPDLAAIQAALAGELQPHADEVATLHEAERWRERLLSDDETQLTAFVERYPACDRTHLRQLVRNAKKEFDLGKPPKSARHLFRFLRDVLHAAESQA